MSARTPYVPVQAKPTTIPAIVQWIGSELERVRAAFYSTTVLTHERITATVDFPSIAAGATHDLLVSIPGASSTDSVLVTPPQSLPSQLFCFGIPANGGAYIRLGNMAGVAQDPASATFTIDRWFAR